MIQAGAHRDASTKLASEKHVGRMRESNGCVRKRLAYQKLSSCNLLVVPQHSSIPLFAATGSDGSLSMQRPTDGTGSTSKRQKSALASSGPTHARPFARLSER